MTNIALAIRQPGLLAQLFRRVLDWLEDPVYVAGAEMHVSTRDWADLPVNHPIRDDRGVR